VLAVRDLPCAILSKLPWERADVFWPHRENADSFLSMAQAYGEDTLRDGSAPFDRPRDCYSLAGSGGPARGVCAALKNSPLFNQPKCPSGYRSNDRICLLLGFYA